MVQTRKARVIIRESEKSNNNRVQTRLAQKARERGIPPWSRHGTRKESRPKRREQGWTRHLLVLLLFINRWTNTLTPILSARTNALLRLQMIQTRPGFEAFPSRSLRFGHNLSGRYLRSFASHLQCSRSSDGPSRAPGHRPRRTCAIEPFGGR